MATLTTIDNIQITFPVKAVSAIADHDAATGEAVTCIYGITKSMLRIRETVADFMHRLGLGPQFAQLTRPNGSPVWIRGGAVSSIRAPLPGEYVAGVSCVIFADSLVQGVSETPDVAIAALNARGGEL